MARNTNTKTASSQPAPVVAENPAANPGPASAPETKTDKPTGDVVSIKGTGARKSIFDQAKASANQIARDKMAVMGVVRQGLAEAADLFKAGTDKEAEAKTVAAKAALSLYQARANNVVSPAEVSAALGDEFGYKLKADGTPGKTPDGQGEAIRKRIVRAAQAHDYVMNGDGGTFFEGLPADEVSSVLAGMEAGNIGFWAAYEAFAEIKREHATKTIPAFNYKHIAGLVDALSEPGAVDKFVDNKILTDVYVELIDTLKILGEAAAAAKAKTKAA